MQITYRAGDFLAGDESVLIHGCNTKGAFGAGVAAQIRERYPFAYRVYRQAYLERGLYLGEVVWAIDIAQDKRPRIIGNAITQENFGHGDQVYVNYDAVRAALSEVRRFVTLSHAGDMVIAGIERIEAVAMPMIGAGLAKGDWDTISAIIEEESQNKFQPVVYRLRPRQPEPL